MSWLTDFLDQAACQNEHPSLFCGPGSDVGETKEEKEQREAKASAVCRSCPVRPECREYAGTVLRHGEPTGIWYGQGFETREAERKRRLRRAAYQRQQEGQPS
ncbi:WhiB family transcriptional regulator [Nonomuraea sp. SYSU D8015]|uniref:WhiB family transcriptional regulator n=1 Tax=Nonomuraea sp. SYSU D8015 TaxID=2593644 RepID=UPI0016612AB2|nr:WhiB family transcriptional regulator [Nonomuraea sp. SYSU D8015]